MAVGRKGWRAYDGIHSAQADGRLDELQVTLELNRIIQKAMAPRRADRYQSMEDLAVDLSRLGRELESGSSPSYEDLAKTAAPRRRLRRLSVLIAGILVPVLIALGVWWFGFRPGKIKQVYFAVLY